MSAIARTMEGPYGRYTWQRVCGLLLISVTTFLLCLAVYIGQGSDFDYDEADEEVTVDETNVAKVTVTATPDYK